ncbi:MAG: hypothetical protein WBD73_08800 [Candidatus Acidiferrales bacterium]
MSYDAKCWDLADAFLGPPEESIYSHENIDELAQRIQDVIEDFIVEKSDASDILEIVHWPGKDTLACPLHAAKLKALGNAMGFVVNSTPSRIGGVCQNCENEARKKSNAGV